jgi:hypothetical protein
MPFQIAFSNLVNFDTGAPERIVSVLKKGKLFQKELCKEFKALACQFTTLSLFAMSKAQSLCTTHNHFVKAYRVIWLSVFKYRFWSWPSDFSIDFYKKSLWLKINILLAPSLPVTRSVTGGRGGAGGVRAGTDLGRLPFQPSPPSRSP